MSVTRTGGMAIRLLAASLAYLVCFVVAYGLLIPRLDTASQEDPGSAMLWVTALNTAALSWLVMRSRQHGFRLMVTLAVVFFGVQTFMPQSDSVIFQINPAFARHVPLAQLPRIFLAGLLHAVLWAPAAVVLLGKRKGEASPAASRPILPATPGDWASRLALASALYVVLYFTFGYFVAWRSPAVTRYYEGTDSGSFWHEMGNTVRDLPLLPLAQVVRGLVWAALAIVIIRTLKASRLETALCVGTLFAVVMSSGLLLPNPFMPHDVRMAHLVETASSDFLLGVALAWLFRRGTRPGEAPLLPRAEPQQVA